MKGKPAYFENADVSCEGWTFSGPMLARREGLYFFVRESGYQGRLLARVMKESLELAGGKLAGILVKLGSRAAQAGQPRPSGIAFRNRTDAAPAYEDVLKDAPGILGCPEFFLIRREDVLTLALRWGGVLEIRSAGIQLDVRGLGPKLQAKLALLKLGYPVTEPPTPVLKLLSYALAAILALMGMASFCLDLYEADKAASKLASKQGVRSVTFGSGSVTYEINGREVSSREMKRLAWHEKLPVSQWSFMLCLLVIAAVCIGKTRSRS